MNTQRAILPRPRRLVILAALLVALLTMPVWQRPPAAHAGCTLLIFCGLPTQGTGPPACEVRAPVVSYNLVHRVRQFSFDLNCPAGAPVQGS
jgi:hypothetical protein